MTYDDALETSIKRYTDPRERSIDAYARFKHELSDNFDGILPDPEFMEDDVDAIRRLHELRDMVDDALEVMEYA